MVEVKIKPDKYGRAIALLLRGGGGFQTRFERTVIVNSEQERALREAGCVARNASRKKARKSSGETKK